jgi:uncharacterized protein YceK
LVKSLRNSIRRLIRDGFERLTRFFFVAQPFNRGDGGFYFIIAHCYSTARRQPAIQAVNRKLLWTYAGYLPGTTVEQCTSGLIAIGMNLYRRFLSERESPRNHRGLSVQKMFLVLVMMAGLSGCASTGSGTTSASDTATGEAKAGVRTVCRKERTSGSSTGSRVNVERVCETVIETAPE